MLLRAPNPPSSLLYFCAPWGSDSNPGTYINPWLTTDHARRSVQPLLGKYPITVSHRGGYYPPQPTVVFSPADSGTIPCPVTYGAFSGETPILDFGTPVTGWALYDGSRNVWRAEVPQGFLARQLWVNGIRCWRARSVVTQRAAIYLGASSNPSSYGPLRQGDPLPHGSTIISAGLTTQDTPLAGWLNQTDIEFTYANDFTPMRLPVQAAVANTIFMAQPGWSSTLNFAGGIYPPLSEPYWIENAYELLVTAGQFYLDRFGTVNGDGDPALYYIPRGGEDLTTAQVLAGTTQNGFVIEGTPPLNAEIPAVPVSNITFSGLTIQHVGWTGLIGGTSWYGGAYAGDAFYIGTTPYAIPGAIQTTICKNINILGCTIQECGGGGIVELNGSKNGSVVGNKVQFCSGGGIILYSLAVAQGLNGSDYQIVNTPVTDNTVHDIGMEYLACFGIHIDQTDNCPSDHNEVYNTPYIGMAQQPNSYTLFYGNNHQRNNIVHHAIQILHDGGSIYRLGPDLNHQTTGNVIHDQGHGPYGMLYLDNYNHYGICQNNCVYNPPLVDLVYELFDNLNVGDVFFGYNFSDQNNFLAFDPSSPPPLGSPPADAPMVVKENQVVPRAATPSGFLFPASIINNAGPRPPWRPARVPTAVVGTPQGLTCTGVVIGSTITISWQAPTQVGTGLVGYELWEGGYMTGTCIRTVPAFDGRGNPLTSYTWDDIAADQTYTLQVVAFDSANNTSPPSSVLTYIAPPATPPHGLYLPYS